MPNLRLPKGNNQGFFELLRIPLNNKKNNCIGRLALIYDITEKKTGAAGVFKAAVAVGRHG